MINRKTGGVKFRIPTYMGLWLGVISPLFDLLGVISVPRVFRLPRWMEDFFHEEYFQGLIDPELR